MALWTAEAACGRAPTTYLPCWSNATPNLPATLERISEDEDEEDATPTPPTPDPPAAVRLEEGRDPSEVLFETIGNLWEEGNDLLVHMMEYYLVRESMVLRNQRVMAGDAASEGRRLTILTEARQVVRAYGTGRTLCDLPPWWKHWMETLLESWQPHDGVETDDTGLMQVKGKADPSNGQDCCRTWKPSH